MVSSKGWTGSEFRTRLMEDGDGCGLIGDCATLAAFASGLVRFTVVLTDVSDVGVSFDIVVKIDLNSFDSRLP